MILPAEEFIRRFLLHVLPEGFVRIRYFGLLSNRHRAENLERCRELLRGNGTALEVAVSRAPAVEGWQALLARLTGRDPTCVQSAGEGTCGWWENWRGWLVLAGDRRREEPDSVGVGYNSLCEGLGVVHPFRV